MTQPIPALILAGGRATRWGGVDKALILLDGNPLLAHSLEGLRPQVGPIALSSNRGAEAYQGYGLPVLADCLPGYLGPLAGILTGMKWAAQLGAQQLITVPVDCPHLPADLVARLTACPAPIAVATAPDQNGAPRRHPTIARWPVALAPQLEGALQNGLRKLGQFADQHGAALVAFSDPLANLNSPSDLPD